MFDKNTIKYQKPYALKVAQIGSFAAIGAIIAAMLFFLGFKEGRNDAPAVTQLERSISITEVDTFSEEKLKEYLLELNLKFPHIVYAQARIETGNFSSRIFKNNNNLFGMKEARQRATTNAGTELGHAVYNNWRESVVDYALYQCAFLSKIRTEAAYYTYLRENYAEDPNYIRLVQSIASDFKENLKSNS